MINGSVTRTTRDQSSNTPVVVNSTSLLRMLENVLFGKVVAGGSRTVAGPRRNCVASIKSSRVLGLVVLLLRQSGHASGVRQPAHSTIRSERGDWGNRQNVHLNAAHAPDVFGRNPYRLPRFLSFIRPKP